MSICKLTLKEIYRGGIISDEAKIHLAGCASCNQIYRELSEIEEILLSTPSVDAPLNLKSSILSQVCQEDRKGSFLPAIQLIFRVAAMIIIMGIGYWLGLRTANGSGKTGIINDVKISQSQVYLMSTEPMDPDSLSQIYFRVLKEENGG